MASTTISSPLLFLPLRLDLLVRFDGKKRSTDWRDEERWEVRGVVRRWEMRGSGATMAFIHFPQIHSLDDTFTVRTLYSINEDRPHHTSITTISDLEGVQTLVFFFLSRARQAGLDFLFLRHPQKPSFGLTCSAPKSVRFMLGWGSQNAALDVWGLDRRSFNLQRVSWIWYV